MLQIRIILLLKCNNLSDLFLKDVYLTRLDYVHLLICNAHLLIYVCNNTLYIGFLQQIKLKNK